MYIIQIDTFKARVQTVKVSQLAHQMVFGRLPSSTDYNIKLSLFTLQTIYKTKFSIFQQMLTRESNDEFVMPSVSQGMIVVSVEVTTIPPVLTISASATFIFLGSWLRCLAGYACCLLENASTQKVAPFFLASNERSDDDSRSIRS